MVSTARQPLQLQRKCACGAPAGPEGECQACREERLQRKADAGGALGAVPPSVHNVLRTPGAPLDAAVRAAMEPHFRHDFGKVRVHADAAAAESARAVHAAAYTVGRDVVFGAGRYAPDSSRGLQLIAHELTHVVQQSQATALGDSRLTVAPADGQAEMEADRAAAGTGSAHVTAGSRSLQRAPDAEWGPEYDDRKSYLGYSYETYKSGLGEIKATTEGGITDNKYRPIVGRMAQKTPAKPEITMDVLKEIFPLVAGDLDEKAVAGKVVQEYLDSLNTAFKLMKIDTVEAQAYYLAHAFIESQQFRLMTEIGDANQKHWSKDTKTPDSPAAQKYFSDTYGKVKTVNPHGKFEFIGRGPVQVTHQAEYVEAIALIERAGEDYQAKAKAATDPKEKAEAQGFADLCKEAVKAIKKNPEEAANPKYTFLFSAAFLKGKGGDVSGANKTPGQDWTGKDVVGGGDFAPDSKQGKALVKKGNAYKDIYCVLMREAKDARMPGAEKKYQLYCAKKPKATAKAAAKSY